MDTKKSDAVVSNCQNGFVPDAFIAENTMRLQILQDIIEEEDRDAIFIFFDMEKAFDRCSWEFLKEGMAALGFNQGFIDYVNLAYSHDNPPTRQLHINGFLGPSFPLGSGVAQGCPLSPLLFLVIAEPLARLINTNDRIEGIVTKRKTAQGNEITHRKISQFADDSTLMLLRADVTEALKMLSIWCAATCMKENEKKREVLLLGTAKLADATGRYITPPPPEIDPHTIVTSGNTIRTLGVPMGNDLDILAWWRKKYAEVKTRMSKWSGLGKLSLSGRNILVQSVVYGCLRYWFFSLPVPVEIANDIETDVKQLLWAAMPEFDANEQGTQNKSNRYMTREASYLPQKQGGGGIMHIQSHISAFQAQWIIKYLDPRKSPWKDALDHWILPAEPSDEKWATALGRGVILTPHGLKQADLIPERSVYIRGCFDAFAALDVKQDTSIIDHRIQGEPLCRNNRFDVGGVSFAEEWRLARTPLRTDRLSDLMSAAGQPFTFPQWRSFVDACAKTDEWKRARLRNIKDVRRSVPDSIKQAMQQPPPPLEEDEIVSVKHAVTDKWVYARCKLDPHGDTYHEVKTDTSGYPHDTGNVLTQTDVSDITRVAIWRSLHRALQRRRIACIARGTQRDHRTNDRIVPT
jgi:hypothetical protein